MFETPSSTGRTSPDYRMPDARPWAKTRARARWSRKPFQPPTVDLRLAKLDHTPIVANRLQQSYLARPSGDTDHLEIPQRRLPPGSTVEVRICAARLIIQPTSVMSQVFNCSSQIVQFIHDVCSLAHPSLVCLPSLELSELDIDLPRIFF